MLNFGSRFNTGVHWCDSVQQQPPRRGYVGNNRWQAPIATDTPKLHGQVVGIDATLLGSKP